MIKIINARGVHYHQMQHTFYSNFYKIQKDNFEWCIFCDIDEYLVGVDNIKTFLSKPRFMNTQQIRIKWKLFGDDNIIERDTYKVHGMFTHEITKSLCNDLKKPNRLERQGKTIVKGHLTNIVFNSVHYAQYNDKPRILPSVLPSGRTCNSLVVIDENYENESVFFYHYMTKSLSEFIEQKMNRTDAVFGDRQLKLNYFWRINEKTKEKEEYLKNKGIL